MDFHGLNFRCSSINREKRENYIPRKFPLIRYSTNKCSITIWPILLLNSVQVITSIDIRLLNGLLMRDYIPFVLTAVQ